MSHGLHGLIFKASDLNSKVHFTEKFICCHIYFSLLFLIREIRGLLFIDKG